MNSSERVKACVAQRKAHEMVLALSTIKGDNAWESIIITTVQDLAVDIKKFCGRLADNEFGNEKGSSK